MCIDTARLFLYNVIKNGGIIQKTNNEVCKIMNHHEKIFSRATIQQICTFLLYGEEGRFDRTPCPYKQHEENAYEEMTAVLREKYPDEMELDKVVGAVGIYTGAIEEIYFEIGFRIGLQLAEELRGALS